MPNNDLKPFAINGAGIAGLTTALALAARGISVVIYEKAEGFQMLGAGLQLSPNAMHVLNNLGLNRWIEQAASEPQTIQISNGITGHRLATLPLGDHARSSFGAPYKVIHRADLQTILYNACKNSPLIDIRFSSKVVEMAPHKQGVTVMVDQDREINERQVSGLIVADGVWSKLRTDVMGLEEPKYSGKIAWRALLPTDTSDQTLDTRVWFGPKSHVVSYPVRGGAYQNLVIITDEPKAESRETISIDVAELQSRFSEWKASFLPLLEQQARWTGWPLYEHQNINRMAFGPVALAGDAAHAMLPFAAQGAAMAIEDAAILAQEVDRHDTVASAFKSYQKQRLSRVSKVAKTARSNGKLYHLSGIRSDFRDLGMWLMPSRLLAARQNWIYSWRP